MKQGGGIHLLFTFPSAPGKVISSRSGTALDADPEGMVGLDVSSLTPSPVYHGSTRQLCLTYGCPPTASLLGSHPLLQGLMGAHLPHDALFQVTQPCSSRHTYCLCYSLGYTLKRHLFKHLSQLGATYSAVNTQTGSSRG